jgi:hypothetical protein
VPKFQIFAWAIAIFAVCGILIALEIGWHNFVIWAGQQFVTGGRYRWVYWILIAGVLWLIWRYYISPQ